MGENMRIMILLTACVLVTSSTYAADEKAKLEGKAQVSATKPASVSPTRSTPAVASESPVCDYSVETDCR